jgi:hypothetical protein
MALVGHTELQFRRQFTLENFLLDRLDDFLFHQFGFLNIGFCLFFI